MRLNLGCGVDVRPGYTNVDFRKIHPSIVEADLSKYPWPFEDGSAEEILMLDFLEHFPYRQTDMILGECWRVMSSDGRLVVQVPDADHLARALTKTGSYLCNRCGSEMGQPHREEALQFCRDCGQSADVIANAAMMRLYGGQDYPGNWHHTCFTKDSLRDRMRSCGFDLHGYEEEEHQFKNWNFKAVYTKGDPWESA